MSYSTVSTVLYGTNAAQYSTRTTHAPCTWPTVLNPDCSDPECTMLYSTVRTVRTHMRVWACWLVLGCFCCDPHARRNPGSEKVRHAAQKCGTRCSSGPLSDPARKAVLSSGVHPRMPAAAACRTSLCYAAPLCVPALFSLCCPCITCGHASPLCVPVLFSRALRGQVVQCTRRTSLYAGCRCPALWHQHHLPSEPPSLLASGPRSQYARSSKCCFNPRSI